MSYGNVLAGRLRTRAADTSSAMPMWGPMYSRQRMAGASAGEPETGEEYATLRAHIRVG